MNVCHTKIERMGIIKSGVFAPQNGFIAANNSVS
jgi:hypothetical protein